MDIFSFAGKERLGSNNLLLKLDQLISWSQVGNYLKSSKLRSDIGRTGYNELLLFKCLLLGQWYSLSDAALEEALRVRIDFMLFANLRVTDSIPDETTICRFRNLLIKHKLYERLLKKINQQLEERGLKLEKANCAVVDATIIESACRPSKEIEMMPVDREEEEKGEEADDRIIHQRLSYDEEARWLKKGNKSYFGYKGFIVTDDEGYVIETDADSANVSECNKLEFISSSINTKRLLADKAYDSLKNREYLKSRYIKDGLMHKARRGKPLTARQKLFNKLIAKKRFVVERCFGTLKQKFQMYRTRYIGIIKVKAQLIMKSICANLLKAANKLIIVG